MSPETLTIVLAIALSGSVMLRLIVLYAKALKQICLLQHQLNASHERSKMLRDMLEQCNAVEDKG